MQPIDITEIMRACRDVCGIAVFHSSEITFGVSRSDHSSGLVLDQTKILMNVSRELTGTVALASAFSLLNQFTAEMVEGQQKARSARETAEFLYAQQQVGTAVLLFAYEKGLIG